jgi:hypothetical protein
MANADKKQSSTEFYSVDVVFAAAAAAHRVQNGAYVKSSSPRWDDQSKQSVPIRSNRDIMIGFLQSQDQITPQDRELGSKIQLYYQTFSFRILSEAKISDFDRGIMTVASGEHVVPRDFGWAAYSPLGYERYVNKQRIDERLAECDPTPLTAIGERVTVTGQVVRSYYSQNYGVYFITVITDDGKAVSCSSRSDITDQAVTITGTVKGYRDSVAQLSRPRIKVL